VARPVAGGRAGCRRTTGPGGALGRAFRPSPGRAETDASFETFPASGGPVAVELDWGYSNPRRSERVNIARTEVRGFQRKEPVLEPESLALRFQVDGSSARLAAR